MDSSPNSFEQARVVIGKAASRLEEVTLLSQAITKAPSGRIQAFQQRNIKNKIDVETETLRERIEGLAKRRRDLEDERISMCRYAEVGYVEL